MESIILVGIFMPSLLIVEASPTIEEIDLGKMMRSVLGLFKNGASNFKSGVLRDCGNGHSGQSAQQIVLFDYLFCLKNLVFLPAEII